MRRYLGIILLCAMVMLVAGQAVAQDDGLNLATELYVLRNIGVVERYGLGAAGVQAITPEDAYVLDFAIAPDNNWMAYRTEEGIYLMNMSTGAVSLLEATGERIPPIRGEGDSIAWSPSGDAVAYTSPFGARVAFNLGSSTPEFRNIPNSPLLTLSWSPGGTHLAVEAENNIWWIYRRNGVEMMLTGAIPEAFGTTWMDDWRLIFAPGEGGLVMMDLANVNLQTILQDASLQYNLPHVRPDGSIVVFSRTPDDPEVDINSGTFQHLRYNNGATSVIESGTSAVDVSHAQWSPDGKVLIALKQNLLGLILPTTGNHFLLPIVDPVAYSWGALYPPEVAGVTLNYDGFFLGMDTFSLTQQVWRLPTNGGAPIMQTAAATDVTAYAVSEMSAEVAYVSDGRLWIVPANTTGEVGEAVELAQVDPDAKDLVFSPDGYTIAFADGSGIWTMAADTDAPNLILSSSPMEQPGDHYYQPQYAPNVNALLVVSYPGEVSPYFWFDPASGELLQMGRYDQATWMVDGRLLGYGDGVHIGEWPPVDEVFVIDPATTPPNVYTVLQAEASRVHDVRVTAPARLSVLLSGNQSVGPLALRLVGVDITGGASQEISQLGYMVDPQISPDGAFVAGLTQDQGRLLIHTVAGNQQVIITEPGGVHHFRWVTIRNGN
jgi:hypothetical protein